MGLLLTDLPHQEIRKGTMNEGDLRYMVSRGGLNQTAWNRTSDDSKNTS